MRWLLLLLATVIGAVSSADDLSNAAEVQALIQSLQKDGLQSVGALNLSRLSKQVDQITWKTTDQALPQPAESEPGWNIVVDPATGRLIDTGSIPIPEHDRPYRQSGHYDPATKTVTLSAPEISAVQNSNSVLQLKLHEALGALGYNDKEYATSSALMILNSATDPQIRNDLSVEFGQGMLSKAALSGGSSVGGGGDITAVDIKNQVLKALRVPGRAFSKEFLLKFPTIVFEPMNDPKNQIVYFDYKIRVRNKSYSQQWKYFVVPENPRYEERATVFFPMVAWKATPRNKKLTVALIKSAILGFVPVYKDTKVEKVAVPYCPGEFFTRPVDPWEILPRTILYDRASNLSRCQNVSDGAAREEGEEVGGEIGWLPPEESEKLGKN